VTKWNLKNASEKEKEIYRQEFEKVYQKELQRRTPVVPASKSVSVGTPKTTAQKQSRAARAFLCCAVCFVKKQPAAEPVRAMETKPLLSGRRKSTKTAGESHNRGRIEQAL